MNDERRHSFYLQVIVILIGLGVLRLWMMPVDVLPRAQAQLPDSGAQRARQIDLSRETNALLRRIESQLRDGTLNVAVIEDNTPARKAPTSGKRRSKP